MSCQFGCLGCHYPFAECDFGCRKLRPLEALGGQPAAQPAAPITEAAATSTASPSLMQPPPDANATSQQYAAESGQLKTTIYCSCSLLECGQQSQLACLLYDRYRLSYKKGITQPAVSNSRYDIFISICAPKARWCKGPNPGSSVQWPCMTY